MFGTSALHHSCSRFGAHHLHLPQHLSYSHGGVQRPQMKVRHRIVMLYFIIVVVLLLSHLHCVIENVTWTIGFHSGLFSAIVKWTLNALSLGSIIVCLVVRIFFVVHRFSTFAVFNPLTSLLALIVSPTVRDDTPHCSFFCLLSFGSLLVTMFSLTSLSQRNRITCFPGDPRYAAMKLTATALLYHDTLRKQLDADCVLDDNYIRCCNEISVQQWPPSVVVTK
jgi:hypothetical protein